MVFDFLRNRKERNFFWVLDIGTEAIKTLICKKEENRIIILGADLQYFDDHTFFGGQDSAEVILKKAILKSIEGALQRFSIASKNKAGDHWKKWPIFLGLPSDILKARIFRYLFEKQNPKEKISKSEDQLIRKKCFEAAKDEISAKFTEETGILAKDIRWLRLGISERKIEGYQASDIIGLSGKELSFKVLAVFLGESYLRNIERILMGIGLKISKIAHISENLFSLQDIEMLDNIVFDAGGDIVQFFLFKNGELETINEFKIGGRIFSQKLSDVLGVSEELARNLKEKYSNNGLNSRASERIKEIFGIEKGYWKENLNSGLKNMDWEGLFPANVFIFGGGGKIPEIKDILSDVFNQPFGKSKIIYPKDLSGFECYAKILDNPQYTPSLLIANSIFNKLSIF
ncbi:MAG: hypothetical protein A3F95_00830 [Candidatus Nealsonbacteria bacterium RIFCSPLOWO2_12_FULL_39_31]|uniref:SHS2 domain-containing protein n=1 Tax=Candidatus Nealsonbacteria bacterium RIFCSPLOWO2_12_FULL_39_31 TaxID=1801676 RepID=A0A1G2EML4_9BACT|nr:MAG: hypothetical protein UT22_C0025G0036 [Parcubacteria group bacterium GW2011_GWC2_39_11]OGZ21483.1 MAG: hypothetical protein A3C48_00900 [Candidatus Nealsonbacteria bacterium RIFCSPHIGHO2_02_FULL_38_75]OGZ22925.1 MAG: hypothetical protein A3E18_00025 [Candidatus Nealsonbacteria bacterium RIFCSPHIGHO2_12_FULL_38_18]OGZ23531.1 MAG: hypothetical protein A2981_02170 [Candidatus Nealsonbacteria bacterium RIFCSPLOWO2_01_FULL_38_120]OGZ25928.1 MAG: hypothetical protein A3I85_00590 [Candidatus Ne